MIFEFRKVFTEAKGRYAKGDVVHGCVAYRTEAQYLVWLDKVNAEYVAGKLPYRVVRGAFDTPGHTCDPDGEPVYDNDCRGCQ